ncbi:MAG: SpoIIE family protein phosphatase, partial [Clostridia bacterium]|nr:SpoIIE family protein phosphatase [Clostridia bacterium]
GFSILFCLYVFGNFACLMCAFLIGIGCAFGQGVFASASVFVLWGVVAVIFKPVRPLCALFLPLADVVAKWFFDGQMAAVPDVVALFLGCVIFAFIPFATVQSWADKLGQSSQEFAIRSIVNRTKNNLSRKLYDLSEVFFEMKHSFSAMVRGVIPREQAKVMLSREVSEQVCHDCSERTACWRTYMEKTEKAFLTIMDGAMDRGKATVFDLPNDMTQKCKRLNGILTHVNQAVDKYKHYYIVTTNSDNSRMLISEQLAGVSDILKSLSQVAKSQTIFDKQKERLLFEMFARYGVLTKEIVVAEEKTGYIVTVVVESKDSKKSCIGKIISKICCTKMMLKESQCVQNKTWNILTFVSAPKFDVLFGFCATKKQDSQISGDTHTFLRIDQNRFLIGLCDGMGSGVNAEKTSSTAISLIENFYKAGFDNQTILSSVNRLLSLAHDETFTAVDISVVDLRQGLCDFIKIGATCGFVKNKDTVEIVSAGSLPLGVLEEMTPCITKKALCDGDVVVMASDGVSDVFESKENFAHFVADLCFKTPQQMADEILQKALDLQEGIAKDDMTVIAFQVFDVTKQKIA